jgi:hypothetical protein
MYGLVNQAVKDLVTTNFGEEKWDLICKKTGFNEKNFVAMKAYPDALTFELVGAAVEILKMDAGAILRASARLLPSL